MFKKYKNKKKTIVEITFADGFVMTIENTHTHTHTHTHTTKERKNRTVQVVRIIEFFPSNPGLKP